MDESYKEEFLNATTRNGTKIIGVKETKELQNEHGRENKPDDISTASWVQLQNPRMGIHSMIAYLIAGGLGNKEIADQVGYSENRISTLRQSELIVREVRRIQERYAGQDLKKRFQTLSPKAIDTVEEVMNDERTKPSVRLQAASLILDHGIGRPQQNIEIGGSLLRQIYEKLDKVEMHQVIDLDKEIMAQASPPEPIEQKKEEVSSGPKDAIDKWAEENL